MDYIRGIIVSILTAAAFSFYPAAAKLSYAAGANPELLIIVTTFVRALALIGFCLLLGQSLWPKGIRVRASVLGGFCQILSIIGIIGALAYIPAAVMIILIYTHPLMIYLFMGVRGEQKLTAATILTMLTALVGLSLVVDLWGQQADLNMTGVVLALMAAVAVAIRVYVYGREVKSFHPLVVGAQAFAVAAMLSLLLGLHRLPAWPLTAVGYWWLLVCCLSLAAGTFGVFYGIALLGSFRWSLMSKLEPIFTALMAFLIIGERLLSTQYLGMLLLLLSLVVYSIMVHSDTDRVPKTPH